MDLNMIIYMTGAFLIVLITAGFVIWGFKTNQFKDNDHLKSLPLEEDGEE
jgi:nitrogen fixation-related uncharacterized protein